MPSIADLRKSLERAKKTAANVREKAEASLRTALTTAETAGSAFIMSYARGRWGNADDRILVGGVDVDLLAGLGGLTASFLGAFGSLGSHAEAISNGTLSCYASHQGFALGYKSRGKTSTSGRTHELPQAQPRVSAESVMGQAQRETIRR